MPPFLCKHTMVKCHNSPMSKRNQIGRDGDIPLTTGRYNFLLDVRTDRVSRNAVTLQRIMSKEPKTVGVLSRTTSDIEVS